MKTFIIDLDNTLLDTERFKGELFRSVKPAISRYLWDKTYWQVMKDYETGYDYTFNGHAEILSAATGIIKSKILKGFNSVAKKLPAFLYHGALPLLRDLKKSNNKIVLLTFGNVNFQKRKVGLLKISKYFDRLILTDHHKDETRLPVKKNGLNTVFINDNPIEFAELKKKYPKAVFLRKLSRFKSRKIMRKEFPPFKNIQSIHSYLKKNRLI